MDSKVALNLIKHWQALCESIVFTDIAPLLIQNKIITLSDYENIKSLPEKAEIESLLLTLLKKNESVLLKFVEALERDYGWLADQIREGYASDQGRDETDATPIIQVDVTGPRERSDDTSAEEETDSSMTAIARNNCINNRVTNRGAKWENRKPIKHRVRNRLRRKVPNSETVISSSTDLMKQQQQQKNEEITDEAMTILRRCSLLSKGWTTIAHSLGLSDRVNEIRIRVTVYNEDWGMCLLYLMQAWKQMFPKEATLSRLIQVLRAENFNEVADELSEKLWSKQ